MKWEAESLKSEMSQSDMSRVSPAGFGFNFEKFRVGFGVELQGIPGYSGLIKVDFLNWKWTTWDRLSGESSRGLGLGFERRDWSISEKRCRCSSFPMSSILTGWPPHLNAVVKSIENAGVKARLEVD